MSIYTNYFSVYERLKSMTMNMLTTQINSHVHDSVFGNKITFTNLAGYILASQIRAGFITGAMIQANSISSSHIINSTIVMDDISPSSLHFDQSTGCAYYKP